MSVARISQYEKLVGKNVLNELRLLARKLKGRSIQYIHFPYGNKNVAAMLSRLVQHMNELGVRASYDTIEADDSLLKVTNIFNSALYGNQVTLTTEIFQEFIRAGERITSKTKLYGDTIFVHDLHSILLIKKKYSYGSRWLWRCHVDISQPDREVWQFLKTFIDGYDASVFSAPRYVRQLSNPQFLIFPSIDPFSERNRDLSGGEIKKTAGKYGIDIKKPIIMHVSGYSYIHDPMSLIEIYRLVKKYTGCQLILAGGKPKGVEAEKLLSAIKEKAGKDPDIKILAEDISDIDINALQRLADVVVQRSDRECFSLNVTEALWKEKPVVASVAGGMQLQIVHNYSGLLSRTIRGCAMHIRLLLNNPGLRTRMGKNGKEQVKRNFISTRHLRDNMLLFLYLDHPKDIVSLYD